MNEKTSVTSRRSNPSRSGKIGTPFAGGSGAQSGTDRPSNGESESPKQNPPEEMVKFDGFQQVLELLQAADPAFRRSLLLRIAERNRMLAMSLMKKLNEE